MTVADAGYTQLRQAVSAAGLLDRAYGYYAWRTTLCFALLGAAIILALRVPSAWPLASIAIAFASVQVALVGHDAAHLAVFKTTRANHALAAVCWTLTAGIGFRYWSDRHNRHHAQTNDLELDPDIQWLRLADRARPYQTRLLLRFLPVAAPLYATCLAFAFRVESATFALKRLCGPQRVLELALLGISQVAWLVPIGWVGAAWLVTYVAAQGLAGLYLTLVIAPNHKGMPLFAKNSELSFMERQVLGSRNIRSDALVDFVMGGLNYQVEHHLFPTMPRVHLRSAQAFVRHACAELGLAYSEVSMRDSYSMVFEELKRVGRAALA